MEASTGRAARPPIVHHESHNREGQLPVPDHIIVREDDELESAAHAKHRRAAALSMEAQNNRSNRNSTASTATNASDGAKGRKTHIGPWLLGKTLGKGATARVRQARHSITGQMAAVKIIQKKTSSLVQAGSLAELSKRDYLDKDAFRRMPYGIEREVAIMKLIEHPHILKLYDIWENRTEIYMVLEFASGGELFDRISSQGRLSEKEAMRYFRQMLSAMGFCHQYNICHRDLKPENILLDEHDNVVIADFGMAAVQQSTQHRLTTSCGSPHYAAPEVIQGRPYKGNKADIWSLGVILFASLCGYLPFDNPSLTQLLMLIQKGKFKINYDIVSADAGDLIKRMLTADPKNRLTIDQLWRHPLVRKYDYIDNYSGGTNIAAANYRDCGRPVLKRSDIDRELMRHLRSLWHHYEEDEIVELLLNDEQNDQKMFYWLWQKYRERQLENFTPDMSYSTSDYHHVTPLAHVRKLSTRQFTATNSLGQKRQISKFTIISNPGPVPQRSASKSSDRQTNVSYDPYRASRHQNIAAASRANVVVYRNVAARLQDERNISRGVPSIASSRQGGKACSTIMPSKKYGTRSSMASSTRSRMTNGKQKASLRYRRGVSFPHVQARQVKHDASGDGNSGKTTTSSPHKRKLSDNRTTSSPYIRSRKSPARNGRHASPQKAKKETHIFHEEVRQLSHSLAKEADEAFNSSALSTFPSSLDSNRDGRQSTPFSSFDHHDFSQSIRGSSKLNIVQIEPVKSPKRYDSRPLPTPPVRSDSAVHLINEARKALEERRNSGHGSVSSRHIDRMTAHMDSLLAPGDEREKRAVSAPTPPRKNIYDAARLRNSNYTTAGDSHYSYDSKAGNGTRHGSSHTAPEPLSYHEAYGRDHVQKATARAVPPSSPAYHTQESNVRRVSHQTVAPRQRDYFTADVPTHVYESDDSPVRTTFDNILDDNQNNASRKKKSSGWFKRASRTSQGSDNVLQERSLNEVKPQEPKKKAFGLGALFKKRNSECKENNEYGFGIDNTIDDDADSEHQWDGLGRPVKEAASDRQIDPQQTWMARLFRVKPAVSYLCFNLSRKRTRQELSLMLKDWRRFGIMDVHCDKHRNIVFARVGKTNYLDIKEVSFACEVMAVKEHGKKGYLSIVRFTQEKGAASSFRRVVETMEQAFKLRDFLVRDERKASMMVKTLQGITEA